ncbi:unnamed protein product, partial [Pelagomonas calceolata]
TTNKLNIPLVPGLEGAAARRELVLRDLRARAHGVVLAVLDHAVLVVRRGPLRLDLLGPRHGAQRRADEVPVVLHGPVPPLLELEGRVHGHLLAAHLAEGLGPADFPRVALQIKVLVAFRAAEVEHFGVVARERDAVAGVDRARAEVAFADPHGCCGAGALRLFSEVLALAVCGLGEVKSRRACGRNARAGAVGSDKLRFVSGGGSATL